MGVGVFGNGDVNQLTNRFCNRLVKYHRRNKHQVYFFKRRSEVQYSRIAIMDEGKSNAAHDGTGCTLLDNAGAYCPDVPSLLLRRSIVLNVGLRLM